MIQPSTKRLSLQTCVVAARSTPHAHVSPVIAGDENTTATTAATGRGAAARDNRAGVLEPAGHLCCPKPPRARTVVVVANQHLLLARQQRHAPAAVNVNGTRRGHRGHLQGGLNVAGVEAEDVHAIAGETQQLCVAGGEQHLLGAALGTLRATIVGKDGKDGA